ncbi:hypothetical protein ACQP2Y_21000 [Actinoplanes sp. CA-051413]|uniref:hypothetical protein n=1 Tax=Actinoplanes sp. CA-051413 TaxID=3239899 RepID=UPI003D95A45A
MDARFEDAWDALDDDQRCLLLTNRDTDHPTAEVTALLVKAGLLMFGTGLGPTAAPAHWPGGLREFLDAKAALVEDLECE